jgi:DNA repair exonuclease SbcCD ATPase subunit
MKIVELISENFKRLNAHVVMDGKNVTVEGKNGVGKSSFIDAIWVALTGKDVPEQPIQQGKESAKIAVTVKGDDGSQFIVERKFLPSGASLAVKTNDGAKFSSPQKFLDQKLGCISFDPFEFIQKQPREQKKFLMELLGIDLTEIDSTKKALLAQKDELGKQHQVLAEEIRKLPVVTEDGADLEEKSTEEAIAKFNEINRKRENVQKTKAHYESLKLEEAQLKLQLENIKAEITELQAKYNDIAETRRNILVKIDSYDPDTFVLPELSNLQAEIEAINTHNEKVKQQKITRLKIEQLNSITAKGKAKAEELKKLEEERVNIIASAKMPIEGLSFSEEGLLFEGLPFTEEQLSTAKLIEAGIKISMALNPNLRIMRIKDGSLLDSDTLAIIKKAAKDNDYQLFIERVSDNKEIGFVIEE